MENENKKMGIEEFYNLNEDIQIKSSKDYFKYLLLETMYSSIDELENKEYSINDLEEMANNLMANDELWDTIYENVWQELINK